jgi:hypothetical protein
MKRRRGEGEEQEKKWREENSTHITHT